MGRLGQVASNASVKAGIEAILTTKGDILHRNATEVVRLGIGSDNEITKVATDILNYEAAGGGATKEAFLNPLSLQSHPTNLYALNTNVGRYASRGITNIEGMRFNWRFPDDFTEITSADLVVIADTTENPIQCDCIIDYAATGELHTQANDQVLDKQIDATINNVYSFDFSDAMDAPSAGDYVGIFIDSDTTYLYPLGIWIKYA